MRRPLPPIKRLRRKRRFLPNTGAPEDLDDTRDWQVELEDWMTGAPGGK